MMSAHKGMGIGQADSTRWRGSRQSLDKFNVPAKERGELLGILGPLKPQIVNL